MVEKDAPNHLWFMEQRDFLLIIFLIFTFMAATAFLICNRHYAFQVEHTLQDDRSTANLLSLVLEERLKKLVSVMESYVQRPLLLQAVRNKNLEKATLHLVNLVKHDTDVSIVVISDRWGTPWASYPEHSPALGKNYAYRDWYKDVSKEWKPSISDVVLRVVGEKDLAVQIGVPFLDEKEEAIGILLCTQRTTHLGEFIKNVPLGPGMDITVTDRKGQIITSRRHDVEKEIKPYPFYASMKKAIAVKNKTFAVDDPDLGGNTRYISFAPLAGTGWTVFVERSKRDILLSDASYYIQATAIALLLFLSIVLFFAYSKKRVMAKHIQDRLMAEKEIHASHERTKQLAEEMAIIAEVGQVIGSTLEIEKVYEGMADEIRKLIPFDSLMINLIRADPAMLEVAYVTALDIPGRRTGDVFPLRGTVVEEAIRSKKGLIVQSDKPQDLVGKFPSLAVSVRAGMHSIMSVPLIADDEVIGNLMMRSRKPFAYTEENLFLAERIGMQITGAIVNARLFGDLRRTENALRENNEMFTLFMRYSPVYTYIKEVTPTQSVVLIASDNFQQMIGIAGSEMAGKTMAELFPAEFAAKMTADDRAVVSRGETLVLDEELNGRSYTTIKFPVKQRDKNLLAGYTIDITQRKRMEEMVHSRLRLIDYAAHHSLAELLQHTLDEVCAMTDSPIGFYHFVEPDQKTLSLQAWSTRTMQEYCRAEGKGLHYGVDQAGVWVDCVHQRRPVIHNDYASLPHRKGLPEGHAALVRELVVPVFREDRIVAILGIGNRAEDYTEKDVDVVAYFADMAWEIAGRKRAEEGLRALLSRQQALLAAVPDIIMEVDVNKVYTWANSAGFLFFGDDVIGKEAAFYFEGEQETYRIVQPLFNGSEEVIYLESWQRRKDGQKRLLAWWCRTLKDESGQITGALSSARDITAENMAAEEIRRLNAELELRVMERTAQLSAVNRELESFSYSVSHDLRAPLRSIDGFSLALLEDYQDQLDETGKAYLERVRKAAQRMGTQIDDMLRLSRVTKSEFNSEPVDLSAMIRAIGEACRENYPNRAIDLIVKEAVVIQGDPRLIRIALENLMDNAFKFTSKVENPRIEFGASAGDGEIVCFIKDNGAGLDMAYADKLFGVFQRLHTKEEYPGSGIGLATVQRVIHRHGGRVWAEGEVGKGATFYFTLPS